MTLRTRFLLLSVSVLAGGVALALLLAGVILQGPALEREEAHLLRSLNLTEPLLRSGEGIPPEARAAALQLGVRTGLRVTIVALDGQVLGDSGVPGGEVQDMANHADRPEVSAALAGRTEVIRRFSATVGSDTRYAAVRTEFGGEPVVLRLGLSEGEARGSFADFRTALVGIALAGAILLWLGGTLLAWSHRRSLTRMTHGVQSLADGDFGALPPAAEFPPDLQPVADALTRMSEEFSGRLREIEAERDEVLSLVDSIAEGVIALSDDARVLRMNRAAGELLEVTRPSNFAPIGTLVRNPGLRDYLEESVVLPLSPREFTTGGRNLLISSHLLEAGGSVVTFLDVTELRRMEKIRRDFVANASHELKTPLTSMRGFAETLLESEPPEELRREFLNSIRKNTIRLQNLVDDLLDLSRLESGAWAVEEEEVEVAAIAEEVWEEVRHQKGEGEIRFSIEGDGVALADSRALHQIFRNLFDNALRFTPSGGSLDVRIEPRGPELRISVRDTGGGIPSASLPRIFERFYRVDPGRDRGAGGTGLGLAIVRHLVQSMGGEIGAWSQLGQGTMIHFTLPKVESE